MAQKFAELPGNAKKCGKSQFLSAKSCVFTFMRLLAQSWEIAFSPNSVLRRKRQTVRQKIMLVVIAGFGFCKDRTQRSWKLVSNVPKAIFSWSCSQTVSIWIKVWALLCVVENSAVFWYHNDADACNCTFESDNTWSGQFISYLKYLQSANMSKIGWKGGESNVLPDSKTFKAPKTPIETPKILPTHCDGLQSCKIPFYPSIVS